MSGFWQVSAPVPFYAQMIHRARRSLVPFEQEDESPFVGLLQVEAA